MDNYSWAKRFRMLFEEAMMTYRSGRQDAETLFDAEQQKFLDEIGATPQEIFDFVEDSSYGDDPGLETTLLITSVRRDYFLTVQRGQRSSRFIDMDKLPPKTAQLDGIEWLPRMIEKARAKLRGEMPKELMYCCGGDRAFLREYNVHPADFLRETWAAKDNDSHILAYVRRAMANGPALAVAPACQLLPGGRVKC